MKNNIAQMFTRPGYTGVHTKVQISTLFTQKLAVFSAILHSILVQIAFIVTDSIVEAN